MDFLDEIISLANTLKAYEDLEYRLEDLEGQDDGSLETKIAELQDAYQAISTRVDDACSALEDADGELSVLSNHIAALENEVGQHHCPHCGH